MYCKYCGNRTDSTSEKCAFCGAKINLRDGGQSFFDDNELKDWQEGGFSDINSSVPKTEIKEIKATPARVRRGARSFQTHKRKKSNGLNITNPNRLIIFCIVLVLAVVLIVVSLIAIFNNANDKKKSIPSSPTGRQENVINTGETENENGEGEESSLDDEQQRGSEEASGDEQHTVDSREPEKKPAATAKPKQTPAPKPKATAKPETTNKPKETVTPTENPEVTSKPEETVTPTEKPEATSTPAPTNIPGITDLISGFQGQGE